MTFDYVGHNFIIKSIAEDRMADVIHMYSYLVSTPGFKLKFYKRIIVAIPL